MAVRFHLTPGFTLLVYSTPPRALFRRLHKQVTALGARKSCRVRLRRKFSLVAENKENKQTKGKPPEEVLHRSPFYFTQVTRYSGAQSLTVPSETLNRTDGEFVLVLVENVTGPVLLKSRERGECARGAFLVALSERRKLARCREQQLDE